MSDILEKYKSIFIQVLGEDKGKELYSCSDYITNYDEKCIWLDKTLHAMREADYSGLKEGLLYKTKPVDLETFVTDPFYLDKKGVLYPKVLPYLKEINSGKYIECVLTGGIGSAKTTISQYTTAYQVYILSCLRNPHYLFDLDPASEILFVFQSLNATLAKNLEFNRFKALVEGSEYFMTQFPFDKNIESRLKFPNRIEVVPVSGAETATIGQNVIGGVLDEVNYMAVVEKSKADVDGGTYDQAWALYNSIVRRRKSRFMVGGTIYGMLCLVSSKRYPGQFTDLKEDEAKAQIAKTGSTKIYVYDKCVWDIKPAKHYEHSGWFYVFVGDESRRVMILEDEDYDRFSEEDKRTKIKKIPEEYRDDFDRDPINALREVAGVSKLATFPYFSNAEAVSKCFKERPSIFTLDSAIITVDNLKVRPKLFKKHGGTPRFCHIDLSKSLDSTGLVIGHVDKFTTIDRGDIIETLPNIVIDGVLEIKPPKFGEIIYSEVRNILYKLREKGLFIKWVTFDSYQSVDSIQILKSQGFVSGVQSMDINVIPYTIAKSALYDVRVDMPEHPLLKKEIQSVEYDPEKVKIDHPSNSTKDVCDALVGVIYGLTMRREIWVQHKIPIARIPESIKQGIQKESSKESTH